MCACLFVIPDSFGRTILSDYLQPREVFQVLDLENEKGYHPRTNQDDQLLACNPYSMLQCSQ